MFVQYEHGRGALIAILECSSIGQRESEILTRSITEESDRHDDGLTLVLDCSRVTFINSTGLGCFITLNKHMKKRKGRVILHRLSDQLLAVLKMTKIDRLFEIENNIQKLEKRLSR